MEASRVVAALNLEYIHPALSICAFRSTAFELQSITKPQIHTAISTTIHRIPATAKRASGPIQSASTPSTHLFWPSRRSKQSPRDSLFLWEMRLRRTISETWPRENDTPVSKRRHFQKQFNRGKDDQDSFDTHIPFFEHSNTTNPAWQFQSYCRRRSNQPHLSLVTNGCVSTWWQFAKITAHTAEKRAATRAGTYLCHQPRYRNCGHISSETDLLVPKDRFTASPAVAALPFTSARLGALWGELTRMRDQTAMETQRKRQEMRLIFRLGTCQPRGLDADFHFIWSSQLSNFKFNSWNRDATHNEHSADEGYSTKTSGHLLRFLHFQ